MNNNIYYNKNNCCFCNKNLQKCEVVGLYTCKCENDYAIYIDGNEYFAVFIINDYKFNVKKNNIKITDLSKNKKTYDCYSIDYSFNVNKNNYLNIIQKVKNFQIYN